MTKRTIVFVGLCVCLLVSPSQAKADGIVFNLNNVSYLEDPLHPVNLAANPGVTLQVNHFIQIPTGFNLQYLVFGFVPSLVSTGVNPQPTVTWTLNFSGLTFTTETLLAQFSAEFDVPEGFWNGITPAELTTTVFDGFGNDLGSQSYSFGLTEPVPEASSFLLLGSGMAGLVTLFRRRSGK